MSPSHLPFIVPFNVTPYPVPCTPKEAKESSSNCWLCDGEETRPSKMTKAFLYKTNPPPKAK